MGTFIEPAATRKVRARVIAGQPIRRLEVFRNDEIASCVEPDADEAALAWDDDAPVTHGTFYCLRVIEESGDKAWASPVWLTVPGQGAQK